jgi:hypothetical protein
MPNEPRETVPAKRGAKALALMCFSLWVFPIYQEGVKSLLARMIGKTITCSNDALFSIVAFTIWIPIVFAWRRPRIGAAVQFGLLAALLAWLALYQPSIVEVWASYALVLLAACFGLWIVTFGGGIVLALVEKRSAVEAMAQTRPPGARIGHPKWYAVTAASVMIVIGFVFITWKLSIQLISSGGSDGFAALAIPGFALGGAYLIWALLRDAGTRFTETSVIRPSITGMRIFPWVEIKQIRGRGNLIDFLFSTGRFRLNLYLFRDSQDVVRYVRARVAESIIAAPY